MRVLEREPARGDRQLTNPVHATEFVRRDEGGGIESLDVSGDCARLSSCRTPSPGGTQLLPLNNPASNAATPIPRPQIQPIPVTASSSSAVGIITNVRYHNDSARGTSTGQDVKIACSLIAGVLLCIPVPAPHKTTIRSRSCSPAERRRKPTSERSAPSFTETTVSTLLRDPLVATGTLQAIVPLRVVMTYTAPSAKTIALDEMRLVVWWPATRQREELNIAETQRRVRKYFTDASPSELREMFTIAMLSDPGFHNAYRLDTDAEAQTGRRGPREACEYGSIPSAC